MSLRNQSQWRIDLQTLLERNAGLDRYIHLAKRVLQAGEVGLLLEWVHSPLPDVVRAVFWAALPGDLADQFVAAELLASKDPWAQINVLQRLTEVEAPATIRQLVKLKSSREEIGSMWVSIHLGKLAKAALHYQETGVTLPKDWISGE